MSAALTGRPSVCRIRGMSFVKICSWSARVAVETTIFFPLKMAGTR